MAPTTREQQAPDRARRVIVALVAALVAVVLVATVVIVLLLRGGDERSTAPAPAPTGSTRPSERPSDRPSDQPSASPSTPQPTGDPGGQAMQDALLAERVGFGADVTGGAGGEVVVVSTDAEDGPGSLREALAGDEPRWIVFADDLGIDLTSPLAVGSNKTVDGRGHRVEITGAGVAGLELDGSTNVIIESLVLSGFGDVTRTSKNDTPDAIFLDGASGVWIDHNDLSRTGDKLVAVTGGSTGVTVSWNHFHDQEQVFQIGNQANGDTDVDQTVTVHHNFFDRTAYRNPVISYGRAHVFNNYYLDWGLYGVRSERGAQMYLEANVFDAGPNIRAGLVVPAGNGCNDSGSRCDNRPGVIIDVDNLMLDRARIRDRGNGSVDGAAFDPGQDYDYSAEEATPELASRIAAEAGPR